MRVECEICGAYTEDPKEIEWAKKYKTCPECRHIGSLFITEEADSMSMFEKINKVIDERYLDGDYIRLHDRNGVHLAEVIEPMLEEEETISQYSVDYAEIYDNPGVTIYYFSIAYVEDGVLEHFTYEIEVC